MQISNTICSICGVIHFKQAIKSFADVFGKEKRQA